LQEERLVGTSSVFGSASMLEKVSNIFFTVIREGERPKQIYSFS